MKETPGQKICVFIVFFQQEGLKLSSEAHTVINMSVEDRDVVKLCGNVIDYIQQSTDQDYIITMFGYIWPLPGEQDTQY